MPKVAIDDARRVNELSDAEVRSCANMIDRDYLSKATCAARWR